MSIHQFLEIMGRKKQTIASCLVVFLLAAVLASATQPFKFGSSLTLLTVHNFKETIDPYVAAKSNESLSNLLARIVSTNSFYAQVMSSGFNIDKNYFKGSDKKQMKLWQKTVRAKSVADSGMIAIDVYHPDRAQTEEIAKAVAYTLQANHAKYHGFGNSVEIKMIDKPITSTLPVKPNLLLNLGLAFAFALMFSLCYIYLFPEEQYDFRLWPKKRRQIAEKEEMEITAYEDSPEEESEEYIAEEIPQTIYPPAENNEADFENHGDMSNIFKR